MDITDFFWNFSQDRAIDELKTAQQRHSGKARRDATEIERLRHENQELQLRLGLLIRLLIERDVFKAEDFTTLLEDTKAKLNKVAEGLSK